MSYNDTLRLQKLTTELNEEIEDLQLEISLMKLRHAAELMQAAHEINRLKNPQPNITHNHLYTVLIPQSRITKQLVNELPVNLQATTSRYVHLHPINRTSLQSILDQGIPCKVTCQYQQSLNS